LAASILSNRKVYLKNLPKVKDIQTMINLLRSLGSKTKFYNNNLIIDNSKLNKKFASYNLVKTMRAGILVLGPLLAKFGNAKVSLPGGCAIGTRPIDIHLDALSKLGVEFIIENGFVRSKVNVLPLSVIPLVDWESFPKGSFELDPYEESSSSDFEQAWIKESPKKANVTVGQVFCKNFLLSIKIVLNFIKSNMYI